MALWAHSGNGDAWHDLIEHLRATSEAARVNAAKFGAGDWGAFVGLVHDLGKANPAFQAYLVACARGARPDKVPHADPGAAAVEDRLGDAVVVVQGHHGGLPDPERSAQRLEEVEEAALEAAEALWRALGSPSVPGDIPPGREGEHFLRMLLSALADADYLDTERHFSGDRERGGYPPLDAYRTRLHAALAGFGAARNEVDRVRREVQAACGQAARDARGFFRLTVPTGGGKTLASLRFALDHAAVHGLDRVVVAIPYTSIVEQTADVYGGIFGPENVLEHHSGAEMDDDEDPAQVRRKLAAENWDCPLVVTTNVQLFESLLAHRPSKVRKLHNLARAVIVLDEAQTLPPDLLEPCLEVLEWMVRHAGTTVVFCTATQPAFETVPKLPASLREAREIVPPGPLFERLRRVRFVDTGTRTPEEVAARLASAAQGLAILNSRRDSVAVFRALDDPEARYLSTYLYPDHRRRVLAEIRERLDRGQPCRVVATQVVEAGVDLDFPLVLRAMAGLDSLVQAAGRCNRHGRMPELGVCEIFRLEGGGVPKGWYTTALDATELVLRTVDVAEIERPEVQHAFFREAYAGTLTDRYRPLKPGQPTQTTVQRQRELRDFPWVAANTRFIEEDTVTVVVATEETRPAIEASLADLRLGRNPRAAYRRLAPFSVSLRRAEANAALKRGDVRADDTGVLLWVGRYDDRLGIGAGAEYAPEDLYA
jgi:CRISPR-associated endonuclease/helicase Cas3